MKSIVERIRSTKNNLLIEVAALEERKSSGGIIIPESSSEFVREGTVRAIGDDVKGFSVGNCVLCSAHSGIRLDMKKYGLIQQGYWMLSTDEILAKIDTE